MTRDVVRTQIVDSLQGAFSEDPYCCTESEIYYIDILCTFFLP